jgi:SAM-dependent methyltransferase
VDHNFFGLFVAKNLIAPGAEYVCCEADLSLPFQDGAFSVAFCSDAFTWIANKVSCIRELKRVTQNDGLIMLVVVRNSIFGNHRYAGSLSPEGYEALVVDMPHRLVGNNHVLIRYLQKQGPALARSDEMSHLIHEPWLSVLASPRQELFRDYPNFDDWPHAHGWLGLNPLYVKESRDRVGNVHLRRVFPTPFYEEENAECKRYLPEVECLSSNVVVDLIHRRRTPELERLIKQCVVLGMPERYRCVGW